MIIITESKEKHYLIKEFINDFLKESTEDPYNNIWPVIPDREQADTVINSPAISVRKQADKVTNTRIFKDDDVIDAIKDEKVLNKIIKKQPKISGIKDLVKKGLITLGIAATLWSFAKNNIDLSNKDNSGVVKLYDAIKKQAETQGVNISKDEIEKSFNTDNNNEISTSNIDNIESPQSNEIRPKEKKKASKNKTSREEIKKLVSKRIKEFESYRPYPYQDAEGISIGYGTQFINKGKVNSLQDDWKDIIYKKIGLSEKEIKEKKKNEKYKESVDKELDQYIAEIDERIEELKNKKDKVVNPYKDKKPKNWKPRYHFKKEFRNKLQKLINNLEKRKEVVKERGVLTKEEAEKCFKIDLENRFDIISIIMNQNTFELEHIEDAFYPNWM